MSKENLKEETNPEVSRKNRRGVSNQTAAVAQLKFHEKDAASNGLFIGHLDSVKVDWSTDETTSIHQPRLTFHFASNHTNANEQRHVYQTLFSVESSVDTIPGGKQAWRVDTVLKWIKHMLDTFYLKGRELTEKEENDLTLDFCDFDDNGDYVAVDAQEVANAYGKMFDVAAAMLNGSYSKDGEEVTGKPCYKDANGKYISIWMKLLRHRKDSKNNTWRNVTQNGDLGFDSFIGAGAIEIQKPNTPPAILRVDMAKESITPKEVNKTPTLGGINPMGGVMGAPMAGMDVAANGFSAGNSAYTEAAGEMPF